MEHINTLADCNDRFIESIDLYDILNIFPKAYDALLEEYKTSLSTFVLDKYNNLTLMYTSYDPGYDVKNFVWDENEWIECTVSDGASGIDYNIAYDKNTSLKKLKSIDKSRKGLVNKHHHLYKPQEIKNNLVRQHVIDYCRKWGVDVQIISQEDFIALDKLYCGWKDRSTHQVGRNKRLCRLTPKTSEEEIILKHADSLKGIDYYPPDPNKFHKVIYISNLFKGNIESHILHELTHILLKVNPSITNEFSSPFTALWYRSLTINDVKIQIMNDVEKRNRYVKTAGYSSFEDIVDNKYPELVKHGLLNDNFDPTFDYSKVKPDVSWIIGWEF